MNWSTSTSNSEEELLKSNGPYRIHTANGMDVVTHGFQIVQRPHVINFPPITVGKLTPDISTPPKEGDAEIEAWKQYT